ncbi:uncharacterized protein N7498_000129 [Penicillium cinerascens]|uniref:STAS domain-containing protein n=1 Tax=Penicillium cinerascens TaxID=70096 RepID=A0A9W9TDY4_9EURO|nr:uncharacterized protein N7498_000129 [Penicillium cinerascens]KAJ5218030.1 hypothetical protein N7498_000129 [Penicillium cinerascens]
MAPVKKMLGLKDHIDPLDKPSESRHEADPTVLDWLNDVVPTWRQFFHHLIRMFPFMNWIKHYNVQWLIGDLIAGATVGAVVIPQGMGYAKLAGLPVQYGLYTSFMGGVVYWLFATSKDITIGPVAIMSTVLGSVIPEVQRIYPGIPAPQIAMSITIICGSIVTFMGLARMGFIVDFIPLPSIAAFMTGSAITICSGQVKTLLGETAEFDNRGPAYQTIINTLKNVPSAKKYDAAMGVSALATLYLIRTACNFCVRKFPRRAKLFFFLTALRTVFIILLFTMISAIVNTHRRDDPAFAIVGQVSRGFEHAGVPVLKADIIKAYVYNLPACVIVLLLEHIAISKSFGRINNYTIDPSQEFIAIGITNLLGPFIGAYSATGSFSRSAIQSKSGSRTPLAGVTTAIVVLVAIYALTTVIFYIPHATLASVIIHAVGDLIVAPNTVYQFWRVSPLDAVIFVIGLVVAIMNTIPNSIYVTVCISIVVLIFRYAKAPGNFLSQTWVGEKQNNRPLFLPIDEFDSDMKPENPRHGVFIYRFSEGFNYPNAGHYTEAMVQSISKSTRRTNAQAYVTKGSRPWNDPEPKRRADGGEEDLPLLRAIILDFSAVNNVDVTSIQNLVDVRNQLNLRAAPLEVQWHFAHVRNRWTKRALAAAGFGFPSPCKNVAVIDGKEEVVSEIHNCGHRHDVEAGVEVCKDAVPCKKTQQWVEPEKGSCNDNPRSADGGSRPFFHIDLISALEKVDVYLARNPVV